MRSVHPLFLTLSLVLNGVLAYTVFTGHVRHADGLAATAAANAARLAAAPVAPAPASVDPQTWARLQTEDLPTLVTRLRETGFPKDMIRAILAGIINEQFAARRRALDPGAAGRSFWKDISPDPTIMIAQQRLYREEQQALRDLLGPDALVTDPLALARLRSRFGDLTPEKLDAVQLIESDYNQKRMEFYYAGRVSTMADQTRLDGELRSALAALLSPSELENYDLRSSRTGQTLRTELTAFNPTEDEFRAIFKLRQPFDERYNYNSGVPSQEQMRERSEAQKQLNAQIASLLGSARGTEYEHSTDYNFRQTSQLIARLELPPETTVSLWTTQKEFEKRRSEIYAANAAASPAERTELLAALQQEAIAKVTPLLGNPSRVEAYKQYGGSSITNLVPRRAPTAPPAR